MASFVLDRKSLARIQWVNCSVNASGNELGTEAPGVMSRKMPVMVLPDASLVYNSLFQVQCNRLHGRLVAAVASYPLGLEVLPCPRDTLSPSVSERSMSLSTSDPSMTSPDSRSSTGTFSLSSSSSASPSQQPSYSRESSSLSRSQTVTLSVSTSASRSNDKASPSAEVTSTKEMTFSDASPSRTVTHTTTWSPSISDTPSLTLLDAVVGVPPPPSTLALVTAFTTAIVLPSTAMTVQRSVLMMNLAQCDFSFEEPLDTASSPTRLCIAGSDGSLRNACIRGGVVGNWLIWIAFGGLSYGFRFIRARMTGRSLLECTDAVYLPGILIVPFVFLLQPTVSATTTLLLHPNPRDGGSEEGASGSFFALDLCLGALSAVLIVAIIVLGWLVCTRWFQSAKMPIDMDEVDEARTSSYSYAALRVTAVLNFWFSDDHVWTDVEPGSNFTQRYGKIFEPFRNNRHGFVLLEVVSSAFSGILGGIMSHTSTDCRSILVLLAVQCGLYIVLVAVLRPYASRLDMLMASFGGLCNFIIAVLTVKGGLSDDATTTNRVLLYSSLLSVLAFLIQIVILMRLHQLLPSVVHSLLKAFAPKPEGSVGAQQAATGHRRSSVREEVRGSEGLLRLDRDDAESDMEPSASTAERGKATNQGSSPHQRSAPSSLVPRQPVFDPLQQQRQSMAVNRILRHLVVAADPATPRGPARLLPLLEAAVAQRQLTSVTHSNQQPGVEQRRLR